jgi:hypothetical protein
MLGERATAMRPTFANYIGGHWVGSGANYEKRGPWRPHEQGRAAIDFYSEIATVYQDL